MANAVFGYNNLIESGTLTAGSEAAGLNISQLKVPQGSSATSWQTASGVKTSANGAWFVADAGYQTDWQAFLLARTSLTPSAQIRWRVGNPDGWTEIAPVLDIDLTAAPSMTGWSATRGGAGAGEATYVNSSGTVVAATGSQFRFTHDPNTLQAMGLLWEPSRTNHCRNPRLLGAATWSQGTLPTAWAVGQELSASLPTGMQYMVVGGATEGGIAYTDIRVFGTPTSANPVVTLKPEINSDGVTPSISSAVGHSWTYTFRLRGSNTFNALPACEFGVAEYQGTTFLSKTSSNLSTVGTTTGTFTTIVRSHAHTVTNASTDGIIPYLQFPLIQGVSYDLFIRVGDFQAVRSSVNYITNTGGVTGRTLGSSGTHATRSSFTDLTGGCNPIVWGTGTENGLTYVDYRIVGNPAGAMSGTFYGDTGNIAAATLGTNFSYSAYAKFVGTPVNQPQHSLVLLEVTSGSANNGTHVAAQSAVGNSTANLSSTRNAASFVVANLLGSTTAFARGGQRFTFAPGSTDVVIRIAAPQLEIGESATSLIYQAGSGTTVTTTRPADGSNRTITAVTNYTVAAEGVVLGAPVTGNTDKSLGTVSVYSSSVNAGSSFGPTRFGSNGVIGSTGSGWNVSATFGEFNGGGTVTVGSIFRMALGYAPGSQAAAINGALNTYYSAPGSHGTTLDRLSITPASAGSICYRRLAIFDSRLTNGRIFSGLAGTGSSLDLNAVTYDSGMVGAGIQVGYGQSFKFSPSPVSGRYVRCDIDDPTNPDGFIAVGFAFAGAIWQPALNIGWETTTNTDAVVDEVITRGGQEFPQYRYEKRRWDVSMQHILDSELWAQAVELQRAGRRGGNVLFAPDPTSADVNKEAVFGRVQSMSDIEYSNNTTQYRSWRMRVTERL